METTTSARHIISDPAICHGEPTFRGTRIMVADVPEQIDRLVYDLYGLTEGEIDVVGGCIG